MLHDFFTQSWAEAWGAAIRSNEAYREAGRTWESPMILLSTADPELGMPERAVWADLFQGDCRAARAATAEDLATSPFILAADVRTWKRVVDGELEPIPGIMRGKLKLTRGSLSKLLPYVAASKQLVISATWVETLFPDGM